MYESKGILQSYNALVTEINDQNLKDITNQIKKLCGISENENTELFKFELAECISEDMAIYEELESCIF